MSNNPKWWKDLNGGSNAKTSDPEAKKDGGFDPASLDGQPVDDSLNHEKLDAVIAHRQLDTTELASDATKAQKVEFINKTSLV